MLRLVWTIAGVAALATVLTASGAAQTPPATLDGEFLTGVPQVTASCNVSGSSTISYTVTGLSGPSYPGTFVESGVATIGPQPVPLGEAAPVTSFSASFVINSGSIEVTGTKQLTEGGVIATNLGFCTDALRSFGVAATYEARIQTPDGTFADQGKAGAALNERPGSGEDPDFIEFFQSALPAPMPVSTEAGKVTGGGSLVGLDANFGFVVQRKVAGGPAGGQWQFVNHASGDIVHSVSITDLEVVGSTATYSGQCRNEAAPAGTPCSFRATVHDNGEGNASPSDTFSVAGTGFTGGTGAVRGNIQIH
jgi:hypothetical protein